MLVPSCPIELTPSVSVLRSKSRQRMFFVARIKPERPIRIMRRTCTRRAIGEIETMLDDLGRRIGPQTLACSRTGRPFMAGRFCRTVGRPGFLAHLSKLSALENYSLFISMLILLFIVVSAVEKYVRSSGRVSRRRVPGVCASQTSLSLSIYIYIHIERERERERQRAGFETSRPGLVR